MEQHHGVDVSWLHHSKDHISQRHDEAQESAEPKHDPVSQSSLASKRTASVPEISLPQESSSKSTPQTPKSPKSPSPGRRSSWVSSLSSRFSSSSQGGGALLSRNRSNSPGSDGRNSSPEKTTRLDHSNPYGAAVPPHVDMNVNPGTNDDKGSQTTMDRIPTPPSSPKPNSAHAFLSSAMRRLSSSSSTSSANNLLGGKSGGTVATSANGAQSVRKVMNVDPFRSRCQMSGLEPKKLRRVAFCVDVEIAGAAQYGEDGGIGSSGDKTSGNGSKVDNLPNGHQRDSEATSPSSERRNDTDNAGSEDLSGKEQQARRKKDKKKKAESGRKERKERKQKDALDNGKIPAEIHGNGVSNGDVVGHANLHDATNGLAPATSTRSRAESTAHDRPTTDPLRIYRRCCQLRETAPLKIITDQLSSTTACPVATPGIIQILNLSGHPLRLDDVITLGDYLAVVPVKKVILENCSLNGEAVRIILAGLLSAKTPEQAHFNRKLSRKKRCKLMEEKIRNMKEDLGVIQKISLKNNPDIGPEGWQHLALFLHMSRSLTAIDCSMIPFSNSIKHDSKSTVDKSKPDTGPSYTFFDAVASRLASSKLEEIVMAECQLNSSEVGRIVDAVLQSGASRLGLASNNLDEVGLEHILRYVRSGKCEGLDIGGNDLAGRMERLAEVLITPDPHMKGGLGLESAGSLGSPQTTNDPITTSHVSDNYNSIKEPTLPAPGPSPSLGLPLYALSLAATKLTPASLATILPALVQLPNLRFIDFSHNPLIFESPKTESSPIIENAKSPVSGLSSLIHYLPMFPILKRLHLLNTSLSSEQAIALAETLPECPVLAHINILENEALRNLTRTSTPRIDSEPPSTDLPIPQNDSEPSSIEKATISEAQREEAVAVYASFMAAARVSRTLVAIDIDVPGDGAGEIVKALARQVIAYCLRNLEAYPLRSEEDQQEQDPARPPAEGQTVSDDIDRSQVAVPDVLLHIVGHADDAEFSNKDDADDDNEPPAPDDDYIIGGTGVAKALGICLQRRRTLTAAADEQIPESGRDQDFKSDDDSGRVDSRPAAKVTDEVVQAAISQGKAKEMSKNLLGSARKIKARLQPAITNEARGGDAMALRRLQFLNETLQGIIQRFEAEFPDTRLPPPSASTTTITTSQPLDASRHSAPIVTPSTSDPPEPQAQNQNTLRTSPSQTHLQLQSQAQEEALMHRFGQKLRRDVLRPQTQDYAHGTTGQEVEAGHIRELRSRLEELGGGEIREGVRKLGVDGVLSVIRGKVDGSGAEKDGKGIEEEDAESRDWRIRLEQICGEITQARGEHDGDESLRE